MDLNETLSLLEQIHDNFRLIVGANGTAEGNLRSGHAICSTCPPEGAAPSGEVVIPPSPPPGTYVVTETLSNECSSMELGTAISRVATPIAGAVGMDCFDPATQDLRPDSNCAKMRDDFNNAQHIKDYANAILDRIRQRGKYKKETTNANTSN